jgi:hypothetical protein
MFRLFLQILGFILLVATVGLATCQSVVKAESAADVEAVFPVTVTKL